MRRGLAGFHLPATLTGYLWLKGLQPHLPGLSCPLRTLTGIPCPTCYLTRATSAALTGDLAGSIRWHAFGPLVAAGLLWWFSDNQSTGDGGSSVCSGFQGRKDLGLTMPHSLVQNHCSHMDLGRFQGVCGEGGRGSMCDALLVA